ncbi:hypothetical protein N7474_009255 [Penicillium riverlandense]|uniref:uncharacterized protein n=1 Tax=Penicillium riverlandense TaxID=1903569 RepID=UPI0025474A30|nr:uncharacterized protein N7474_009255 [Penicillium riverlandense]KAJ5807986.1 hypothetical protein N7474_009255 [Penicillium riverlandense]
MGSELGITAHTKPGLAITPVSIWWVCWAGVWTVCVALGMAYLIVHRNTPTVRIRGLGLSLSAVVLLHMYWASVQTGVMIGPVMPGDAQYWIMGTYLPCGMALFHASNSRFLHVAKLQKKYVQPRNSVCGSPSQRRSLISRFHRLPYTTKTLIIVGILMVVQIFLTVLMYLISRKWHSSWGIPGTEVHGTPMEKMMEQGTGWEWWPGVFSQFFWSWLVAPIVLWKSRNIHDTQGWRVQTIGCAIAGLHATPMWLISLYVPGMAPVNQYWIPPQWICLSVIFLEIFTIFIPCWEVMRRQTLRRETLDAIAQWEKRNQTSDSGAKSLASGSTMVESLLSGRKSRKSVRTNASDESILTMSALEYVLERNPGPLQEFSALREFSGENVAFLTAVSNWKNSLPPSVRDGTALKDGNSKDLIRAHFNTALHIYAEFISREHAEFPLNIASTDVRKLQNTFDNATRIVYGEKDEPNPVSPFSATFPVDPPLSPSTSTTSEKTLNVPESDAIKDLVQYWGEVPVEFDGSVFDSAEHSIKYLVLTNTWPKFVKDPKTWGGQV